MDILPICEREHRKILSGVCPWCKRQILQGKPVGPSKESQCNGQPIDNGRLGSIIQEIYDRLIEKLDLSNVSDLASETLRRELRLVVERLCDTNHTLLTRMQRERVVEAVLDRLGIS